MVARSKIQILLLVLMTSAFGLSACNYRIDKMNLEKDDPIHKPGDNSGQDTGEKPERLSWLNVFAEVIKPKCVDCHKGMAEYEKVKKKIPAIRKEVFVMRTMPKGGSLTEEQSRLLSDWIDAGAPENTPEVKPEEPIVVKLSWNNVFAKVFEPRCIDCHRGLKTYARVKEKIADIELEVFTFGSMPEDGPLTAEQSELLKNWIAAGAPEVAPTLIQDAQGNLSFKK
ncbi:MAG: hypothetical protein AB7O96_02110 [Pseudobdellovibrionaceae bacterium]